MQIRLAAARYAAESSAPACAWCTNLPRRLAWIDRQRTRESPRQQRIGCAWSANDNPCTVCSRWATGSSLLSDPRGLRRNSHRSRQRKGKRAAATRRAVAPDPSAVCFDEPSRYREPESAASMVVAARLPEIVEQVVYVRRRNSGPVVRNVYRDMIVARIGAYGHGSVLRREFESVTYDVADDLRDAARIRAYDNSVIWWNCLQINSALFSDRPERLDRLAKNRHHRYVLEVEHELARVHAHCVEQVTDETVHVPSRSECNFQHLRPSRPIEILLQQQIGAGDDDAERIAQIVRYDAEHFFARLRQQLRDVSFLALCVVAPPHFFVEALQLGGARFGQAQRPVQRLHS